MKRDLTYRLLSVVPALLCAVAVTVIRLLQPAALTAAFAAGALCLALAVLAFTLRGRFAPALTEGSFATTFSSSVTGIMMLACFAFDMYFRYFAPMEERIAVVNGAVAGLASLFCLLGALYFLFNALAPSLLANDAIHLAGAMMPVLYCAFRILCDFIATGTMPLANGGGYHILSMIAAMLFLLCEAKIVSKRGKTLSYLLFGQIAIVLSVAYNIPFLVHFADVPFAERMHGVLFLALALYIAARLFFLAPKAQEPETQEPETQE